MYTLLIATVISWTLLELAAGIATEKEQEREGSKKEWSSICDDLMQRNNVKLNLKWNFLICPQGTMYYPYTFSLLKFFNMQSNKVRLHDCQSYNDVHQHTIEILFYKSSMQIMNKGQSNVLESKLSCLRISQLISKYSRCLFTFICFFFVDSLSHYIRCLRMHDDVHVLSIYCCGVETLFDSVAPNIHSFLPSSHLHQFKQKMPRVRNVF